MSLGCSLLLVPSYCAAAILDAMGLAHVSDTVSVDFLLETRWGKAAAISSDSGGHLEGGLQWLTMGCRWLGIVQHWRVGCRFDRVREKEPPWRGAREALEIIKYISFTE